MLADRGVQFIAVLGAKGGSAAPMPGFWAGAQRRSRSCADDDTGARSSGDDGPIMRHGPPIMAGRRPLA